MNYQTIEVRRVENFLSVERMSKYPVKVLLKDKSQTASFNNIKNILFKSLHSHNPGGRYWLCINCKVIGQSFERRDDMYRRVTIKLKCDNLVMSHTKLDEDEIMKELI